MSSLNPFFNLNQNQNNNILNRKIINILYTMNFMFTNKICICEKWCCQIKCKNVTFDNIAKFPSINLD